jgi:hypothetical protein
MLKRFKKPTVFLVGGTITILYSIPTIMYYLPRDGGESMYALGYFYFILLALLAFVIDVGLAARTTYKITLITEVSIIIIAYLAVSYQEKQVSIDISAIKKPFIIVIDDPKGINVNQFGWTGVFDRTLKVADTPFIQVNLSPFKDQIIYFDGPKSWQTGPYTIPFKKPQYKYNGELVTILTLSDEQCDSLLKTELVKYPNK